MEKIWHKKLDILANQYDWISRMYSVPQSPVYHAEGDVGTHTQMVLAALENDIDYLYLSQKEQQIVWTAALLHDIEKYSTTFTDENGDIVSPGHAKKGAQSSRVILYKDFNCSFYDREKIVQLVRHHGLPIWLMHKLHPQKTLLEAAMHTPMPLLKLLTTADINGRICNDQQDLLERMDFFEAYCQEQQVWTHPYPFSTPGARFHYFNSNQYNEPCYIPYEDYGSEVVIMSGLPGMGKDSYIKQYYADWPVISLDAIRTFHQLKPTDSSATGWVVQQAKEVAKGYLRKKQRFVWNATNITRQMRNQLIGMMQNYNAHITIVYIEKPWKTWMLQNKQRESMVPENILSKMLYKLEIPLLSEAHHVRYII